MYYQDKHDNHSSKNSGASPIFPQPFTNVSDNNINPNVNPSQVKIQNNKTMRSHHQNNKQKEHRNNNKNNAVNMVSHQAQF